MIAAVEPTRRALLAHPLYAALGTPEALRLFQSRHVFVVWDFQSLLLALRQRLTRTALPWIPHGDPLVRRLVNEIALGEESDEDGRGGFLSHFELYREAMRESGADTAPVDRLTGALAAGTPFPEALAACGASRATQAFVGTTLSICTGGGDHEVAAAFTIGREELVPEIFRRMVDRAADQAPGRFARFRYYLDRHIEVDTGSHGPASRRMLDLLCGDRPARRAEAEAAAARSLAARLALWDEIASDLSRLPLRAK